MIICILLYHIFILIVLLYYLYIYIIILVFILASFYPLEIVRYRNNNDNIHLEGDRMIRDEQASNENPKYK